MAAQKPDPTKAAARHGSETNIPAAPAAAPRDAQPRIHAEGAGGTALGLSAIGMGLATQTATHAGQSDLLSQAAEEPGKAPDLAGDRAVAGAETFASMAPAGAFAVAQSAVPAGASQVPQAGAAASGGGTPAADSVAAFAPPLGRIGDQEAGELSIRAAVNTTLPAAEPPAAAPVTDRVAAAPSRVVAGDGQKAAAADAGPVAQDGTAAEDAPSEADGSLLGEDGLVDSLVSPILGADGLLGTVTDSLVDPILGPDGLVSDLLNPILGKDGLLGNLVTPILGVGGLIDSLVSPILGPDGLLGTVTDSLLDPILGPEGLVSDVLAPVLGEDGLVDSLVSPILGPEGLLGTVTDSLLDPILGPDGLVGEVLAPVLGEDGLVDSLVSPILGPDGLLGTVTDSLLDPILRPDGLVGEVLAPILGEDGALGSVVGVVQEGLLEPILGESGLLGGIAAPILAEDGLLGGITAPILGEGGLLGPILGPGGLLGGLTGSLLGRGSASSATVPAQASPAPVLEEPGALAASLAEPVSEEGALTTGVLGAVADAVGTGEPILDEDGALSAGLDLVQDVLGPVAGEGGLLGGIAAGIAGQAAPEPASGSDPALPLAGGLLDELTGLLAAGAGQEPQLSAGAPTGEEHGDDDGFLESLIGGDPSIAGAVFDASDMVTDLLFHELLSDQDVFGIDPAAEPPLTDDLVGGLLGVVGLEAALAQPQAAASDALAGHDPEVDSLLNEIIDSGERATGGVTDPLAALLDPIGAEIGEGGLFAADAAVENALATLFGEDAVESEAASSLLGGGGLLGQLGLFPGDDDNH